MAGSLKVVRVPILTIIFVQVAFEVPRLHLLIALVRRRPALLLFSCPALLLFFCFLFLDVFLILVLPCHSYWSVFSYY